MQIKKALTADHPIVEQITQRTIREIYPHYYPQGAVAFFLHHHRTDNIAKDIAEGCVFLCYDSDQNPVGTVTIRKNEINRLFVLPEYQGRGYGTALLQFAEAEIARNYNEIILDASLPAKAIYLKKGYTECGYHTICTEHGDYLCYDEMKKQLSTAKIITQQEETNMRKNLGAKAILYPMPVLIIGSYDEAGTPDAMNAAWGGISEETQISICVSETHRTTANILARKAFTVSIADAENVIPADYVGIVSGNKQPDKIAKAGWTAVQSENVDAPLFAELPLALECRLISYDEESCRLVGEIVNVCADERILANGRVDLSKFRPITYDPVNHDYLTLGDVVGKAFSDGAKLK